MNTTLNKEQCVVKTEFYSHTFLAKISSNQLFSNFFSKNVASRKFCQKSARVNFRECGNCRNLLSKFCEINACVVPNCTLCSRNIGYFLHIAFMGEKIGYNFNFS